MQHRSRHRRQIPQRPAQPRFRWSCSPHCQRLSAPDFGTIFGRLHNPI
jgi:hypothetical protein